MNLAVLGTDPDLLSLLAAAKSDGHEIIWLGDVRPADQPAVRQLVAENVNPSSAWETLLDHAMADGVIIGRGAASEELRSEQLKRFVADAVPLLVVHPPVLSVLTYYELDMVRRETGCIIRHYNPLVGHPAHSELARWIREGHETIGNVLQVVCTSAISDDSREKVLAALARDMELLSFVAGDIHRVSAIGPREAAATYASLQVQMTSPWPATMRWSVVPGSLHDGRMILTLVGERGSIEWTQDSHNAGAGLSLPSYSLRQTTNESENVSIPSFNAPQIAIRQLAAAIEQRADSNDPKNVTHLSTWENATRAMEVVDAIELSLQKGRTIEVHQQKLTEQLAFRGTMAALGCGLLLAVTLLMIIVGIVGGVEALIGESVMKSWSLVLLAVLAFFLLLQIVPYLASKKTPSAPDEIVHD